MSDTPKHDSAQDQPALPDAKTDAASEGVAPASPPAIEADEIPVLTPSSSADDTVEPEPEPEPEPAKQRLATVLALLALLCSLLVAAAIGYGAYWLWPQYQSMQDWPRQQSQQQTQQATALTQLQQQLTKLEQQLSQTSRHNDTLASDLADSGVLIVDLQAQINAIRHTDRSDWLLAEVEFLTRLAHQRLMSDRNVEVASGLLLQADEILRDMERADLFAVRSQLATDIQALRMANSLDVTGMLIELQTLNNAVQHLTLLPKRQFNSGAVSSTAVEAEPTETLSWYDKMTRQLSALYRIQSIEEPPEPVLSLEQVGLLKQQVKLRLVQAEYALLRSDQRLYDQSLRFCVETLGQYASKSANQAVFMERLEVLRQQKIVVELPDITGSHSAVYDYLEARRAQPKEMENAL